MGRNIKVVCINYCNTPADVAKGLKGCIDIWALLIDRAALDRPDIILLPESFVLGGLKYALPDIAEPLPGDGGPITRFLTEKAAQHNVYIFAGYYRKNGAHIYNSAVLFGRSGAVAGFYDKVFPTIGELEQGISPGQEAVVIETELGRLGAAICFDFNFSELFLEYQRKRADLICFLSAYAGGLQLPIRAFQHHYHIASATPSIPSMIVNPLGRVLATSSRSSSSSMIQATINLDCRVLHMDYNIKHVWDIKQKYGPKVMIEEASPEAVYLLTACDPDLSADEVIREFGLELFDDYLYRERALAEYEWNMKGRHAEEFADPGLFMEWRRVLNSPVGRRMTQAWGATVQQTWLARLPEDMAIEDFNSGETDTPEKNAADARRALTAAEKMENKPLILTARSLAAYCELETSGYGWMRRDAAKTKTISNDRPSYKELRERFAAAMQKYIAARQAEIKGLDLVGFHEKAALNGSAPLEKVMELFRAEPPETRVYLQEKITGGWELPPKALLGGELMGEFLKKHKEQGYPGVVIRRKSSSVPRVRCYWRLDTLPEKGAELQVQGSDNEKKEKAEIVIKINGHEIFAGPVDFPKNSWGWQKHKVVREYLQQGENVIVIENTTRDYKADMTGQAGPANEALAQDQDYNWGWCIVGSMRLTGWSQ